VTETFVSVASRIVSLYVRKDTAMEKPVVAGLTQKQYFKNLLDRVEDFWRRRGRKVDFSVFEIPHELPEDFIIPLYIPEGISNENACQICEKGGRLMGINFPVKRFRDPMEFSGSEALAQPKLLLVRDTTWPDSKYLGKSADDLDSITKVLFEDLRDRTLHEAIHYDLFSRHLSVNNMTWCPKSRLSVGYAAYTNWSSTGGWFYVSATYSDHCDPLFGGREAISISLKS